VQNQLVRYKSLRSAWLLLVLLLPACSKDGPEPEERFIAPVQSPPPQPETVFVAIDQGFFGQVGCDSTSELSFLSFDPDSPLTPATCDTELGFEANQEIANPKRVVKANNQIRLELFTRLNEMGEPESLRPDKTLLEGVGTIKLIDHTTDFVTSYVLPTQSFICDLLPATRVETANGSGAIQQFNILNENYIYIVLANDGTSNACQNTSGVFQYLKLPFNYQFDARDENVCDNEPQGQSDDYSSCKTRILTYVSESEATAQIVFGWVNDEDTPTPLDMKLSFGFLGYSYEDQKLRFYDESKALEWEQSRQVETFTASNLNQYNEKPARVFNLTALPNQQYLLQIGRDIFLFDSSSELFSRSLADVDVLFSDRILKVTPNADGSINVLKPNFDDDDLVLIDQFKVFSKEYLSDYVEPVKSGEFQVYNAGYLEFNPVYRAFQSFSQFDLQDCRFNSNASACADAHMTDDSSWTFIEDCSSATNCSFDVDTTDYCVSPAEENVSTLPDELCTPSKYEDLNELDDTQNDAIFRGFIQYGPDFIRSADYELFEDSLLITARMQEREVLVRYFFKEDLSSPKASREQLLLGQRLAHGAIQASTDNNDLYINTLVSRNMISNRCFSGYSEIPCDLNELEENGSGVCTGKDVNEGLCIDKYSEYESLALYCSNSDLTAGNCNDDGISSLRVGPDQHYVKWLQVQEPSNFDIDAPLPYQNSFYALVAPDIEPSSSGESNLSYVREEGVLGNPLLIEVSDPENNVLGRTLGRIEGEVESSYPIRLDSSEVGRLDVNSQEIANANGVSADSESSIFFIKGFDLSSVEVFKAGSINYPRPETR
jgi:hypothetical protein